MKFDFLFTKAFELGAYHVATGHYAQKHRDPETGEWQLRKGRDGRKDQSYFLFSLGQRQLEHTLFPVGGMDKEEVRRLAREAGLKTSEKPDSQEICFVPGGDHGDFIAKYLQGAAPAAGEIVNESGEVLGRHEGIHRYTVGQRRGTQVAQGERVYVKAIDPRTNRITMSDNGALFQPVLLASGVRWVRPVSDGIEVTARIRHRHEGSPATLRLVEAGRVRVEFHEAQQAISPGRRWCFYAAVSRRRLVEQAWARPRAARRDAKQENLDGRTTVAFATLGCKANQYGCDFLEASCAHAVSAWSTSGKGRHLHHQHLPSPTAPTWTATNLIHAAPRQPNCFKIVTEAATLDQATRSPGSRRRDLVLGNDKKSQAPRLPIELGRPGGDDRVDDIFRQTGLRDLRDGELLQEYPRLRQNSGRLR